MVLYIVKMVNGEPVLVVKADSLEQARKTVRLLKNPKVLGDIPIEIWNEADHILERYPRGVYPVLATD